MKMISRFVKKKPAIIIIFIINLLDSQNHGNLNKAMKWSSTLVKLCFLKVCFRNVFLFLKNNVLDLVKS